MKELRKRKAVIPTSCLVSSFFHASLDSFEGVLLPLYGLTVPVLCKKVKGSPYSITEHRVPELSPILGSQPAGDVSHKPGCRLPLLSARPAVTPATYQFCCLVNRGTMGVSSLPMTVTRQHRDCDLNPGLLCLSPVR